MPKIGLFIYYNGSAYASVFHDTQYLGRSGCAFKAIPILNPKNIIRTLIFEYHSNALVVQGDTFCYIYSIFLLLLLHIKNFPLAEVILRPELMGSYVRILRTSVVFDTQ